MTTAKWTRDLKAKTYQEALDIRHEVFVKEQDVPVDVEIDDLENQTAHIVLYKNSKPIATARILKLDKHTYKIQRVAVLKKWRQQGYGRKLMEEIEKKVKELKGSKLTLGAQNTALDFYGKLGYEIEGDEFMDAGIPHHTMVKNIPSK